LSQKQEIQKAVAVLEGLHQEGLGGARVCQNLVKALQKLGRNERVQEILENQPKPDFIQDVPTLQ
jgi:hypothetical protein